MCACVAPRDPKPENILVESLKRQTRSFGPREARTWHILSSSSITLTVTSTMRSEAINIRGWRITSLVQCPYTLCQVIVIRDFIILLKRYMWQWLSVIDTDTGNWRITAIVNKTSNLISNISGSVESPQSGMSKATMLTQRPTFKLAVAEKLYGLHGFQLFWKESYYENLVADIWQISPAALAFSIKTSLWSSWRILKDEGLARVFPSAVLRRKRGWPGTRWSTGDTVAGKWNIRTGIFNHASTRFVRQT